MKEPTKEQIKELWEWCGWKTEVHPYEASFVDGAKGENFDVVFWYSPEEPHEPQAMPPIDLNNLFKYAVPKLKVDEDLVMFAHPIESAKYYCEILDADGESVAGSLAYNDPALALFRAIYKVIK